MSKNITLGIVITLSIVVVFGFFFIRPVTNLLTASMSSSPAPTPKPSSVQQPTTPPTITDSQTTSPTGATANAIASTDASEVVTVVAYTSSGFQPSTVEILQGQTVTFVNQSDRKMWVGVDDHPTHTKYPVKSDSDCGGSSFDSCKGYAPGESWSFIFTEVGSWEYHNHSQATHRGTVVVK